MKNGELRVEKGCHSECRAETANGRDCGAAGAAARPDGPTDPGRTREVGRGKDEELDPRDLGPLPGATVSSRSQRGPGAAPQDAAAGGNVEGIRTAVPAEYRSRYEAYLNSIARTPRPAPAPPAPPAGGR